MLNVDYAVHIAEPSYMEMKNAVRNLAMAGLWFSSNGLALGGHEPENRILILKNLETRQVKKAATISPDEDLTEPELFS